MKKIGKLTLTRETVRELAVTTLNGVAGGSGTSFWCSRTCASGCDFCPL